MKLGRRVGWNAPKDVIVNNDGHSTFFSGGFKTKKEIEEYVDQFKGTDVTILEYCVCCSVFFAATKVGDVMGTGIPDAELAQVRRGDRLAAESVQRLIADGVDPLAVIAQRAKEDGIAAFASVRMNAYLGPPWDAVFNGSFWKRNRDMCVLSPQGWSYANLSYAYPEVRQWYLDVVAETAERDIMGVNLDFLRHPPFFGVEKPLVEGYQARYGQAPPPDPAWWTGTLTPGTDDDPRLGGARAALVHAGGRRDPDIQRAGGG